VVSAASILSVLLYILWLRNQEKRHKHVGRTHFPNFKTATTIITFDVSRHHCAKCNSIAYSLLCDLSGQIQPRWPPAVGLGRRRPAARQSMRMRQMRLRCSRRQDGRDERICPGLMLSRVAG